MLARRQAEKGGELAPARKPAHVANRRHDRGGRDRTDSGDRHQSPSLLVGLHLRRDLRIDGSQLLIERLNLLAQRAKRPANAFGNHDLAVLVGAIAQHPLQPIGVLRPLRRDDSDLGHVSAQGVNQRRALTGEQFARAMAHQLGLVVDGSHRDEALAGAHRGLADRRRVSRVVLVAPNVRLHMRGWDQLHLVPEFDQSAAPVMRRWTSLHRYDARWQLAKEPQHRATPQRPRRDNLALRVDRVDLQNILRQIDANARDSSQILDRLAHGRLPSDGL